MTEPRHDEHKEGTGFERQDLSSKPVYGFLISLVIIGLLVYFTIWGIFRVLDAYFNKHQGPTSPLVQRAEVNTRRSDASDVESTFPNPRLEIDERGELNDPRLSEEQTLNSYGWVDQGDGVVRIPITKAMGLIAQRGLPTMPAAGTVASAASKSKEPGNPAGKQTGKGKQQ